MFEVTERLAEINFGTERSDREKGCDNQQADEQAILPTATRQLLHSFFLCKMFQTAIRAAARPAFSGARAALRRPATSLRAFSTTQRANSGPPPPQLFGAGGKPGEVPTDIEQATGLERLQLLGELEGINVFDQEALDSSRVGTKADPIKVLSYVRADVAKGKNLD